MANSSLLYIPAEIRLNIYRYITPVDSPISTYAGLFLSCKSLYAEATVEVLKNVKQWIPQLEREWKQKHGNRIHFTVPQTLQDLPQLTVSLPMRWIYMYVGGEVCKGLEDILRLLKVLHLRTLMIRFIKEGWEDTLHKNDIFLETGNPKISEKANLSMASSKLPGMGSWLSPIINSALDAHYWAYREILGSLCLIEAKSTRAWHDQLDIKGPQLEQVVLDCRYAGKPGRLREYLEHILGLRIPYDFSGDWITMYPGKKTAWNRRPE
jgi:hypothetical protein